jgi:hypothetical protein
MSSSIFRGHRELSLPPLAGADSPDAQPINGDIVVGPVDGPPGRFGLRQLPHGYEIVGATLSECVSTGRRFATANRVDIWSMDAHGRPTLIERNRLGRHRHDA